jgi:Cu-Zn family superoxide dismutase
VSYRTITRHLPHLAVAAAVTLFAASPALAGADRIVARGDLQRYGDRLPEGAGAHVQAVSTPTGDTLVTLRVWGLEPNTEYGAHAHVNPCGETGAAAGPHFQHVPNPRPDLYPTNPEYANPVNEVWLDLVTNSAGRAVVRTTQPWQFAPGNGARSVIIHEEHTHTGPLDSGVAGARLGCLDVDF